MSAATTVRNFTDAVVTIDDDGGNSNTLPLLIGTVSWSGLTPDGRELETYEVRGGLTGARKGARSYPEVTIEAQVARMDDDFYQQAMGVLAGFVSTTADIGDMPANDLTIDESYSTDSRVSIGEDAVLTEWSYSGGSPGKVSMTFKVLGPLSIDGTTYVSSR